MEKVIKNIDAVAHKFKLASIKITNHRLKVAREKRRKKKEIIKWRKTEAIVIKRPKARERISLSNEKEENYESNIENKTNLDQANNEYQLLKWETMGEKLWVTSKIV